MDEPHLPIVDWQPERPYPFWVRLMIIVGPSAALWGLAMAVARPLLAGA